MIENVGDRGGSIVAKGVISAGTSYALARHYHGKKDATARVPMGVAIGGKLIPALAALFLGDDLGVAGPILGAADAAGQGALDFLAVVQGLRHARQNKGLRAFAAPASFDVKVLPTGSITDAALLGDEVAMLGALGRAQPGSAMTPEKIRDLQAYR